SKPILAEELNLENEASSRRRSEDDPRCRNPDGEPKPLRCKAGVELRRTVTRWISTLATVAQSGWPAWRRLSRRALSRPGPAPVTGRDFSGGLDSAARARCVPPRDSVKTAAPSVVDAGAGFRLEYN